MATAVIDMSKLSDLAPVAKRLNAASDEFTKTLETIQDKLNAYALGVEVWLQSEDSELGRVITGAGGSTRTVRIQELGYGRIGEGWALLVRSCDYSQTYNGAGWDYDDGEAAEVERKPLVKASRPARARSIELIPQLIDSLRAAALNIIATVEKAKKIADSLE